MKKFELSKDALHFFADSGLTKSHAEKMQIRDMDSEDLKRVFPKARLTKDYPDGHVIPYFDLSGSVSEFRRYRIHDESYPKYLQDAGKKSQFYFPPFMDWKEIAVDPSIPIYITEGERKAAKACTMGLPCIGLGGVWNWLSSNKDGEENAKSQLIKDFQLIEWKGRSTTIVFDSDSYFNTNVQAAIKKLRDHLVTLGANPYRKDLPHQAGVGKIGVDDFLKQKGGKKAFEALRHVPLLLNQTIPGDKLMEMKIEPTKWIVKGLIPAGLTVLAGPPKVGKSWLVLALVLSAAAGGKALNHYETEPMDCLYLALEDSPRRLKARINILGKAGYTVGGRVRFACDWERVVDGGLVALERRLDEMPNCKAVFIDTFAKMRNAPRGRESLYHEDYEAVGVLKRVADQRGIGIVVVHHTKKGATEDFLESVSGSSGVTGGADTVIVLRRNRNDKEGILHVTGRDVTEQAIAISLNDGAWAYRGEAAFVQTTETQEAVLEMMKTENRPLRQKELADLTGKKNGGFTKTLARMVTAGLVTRDKGGLYTPVDQSGKTPPKFAHKNLKGKGKKQ